MNPRPRPRHRRDAGVRARTIRANWRAIAVTRFLETFLWEVTPSDPATFLTIAAILVTTGIVACLVPATRATRIDPLVALRHD